MIVSPSITTSLYLLTIENILSSASKVTINVLSAGSGVIRVEGSFPSPTVDLPGAFIPYLQPWISNGLSIVIYDVILYIYYYLKCNF